MTRNLNLLSNFVEKFLGTVKFRNDQIALILGYGDLVQGNITIKRVYYVEGLNHNLFSVGKFCDTDLEVAFWKSTYYIRDLKGNDLLTGSRGTNMYSITLQDTSTPNQICLMADASSSQAWLWHRRLSHLNFYSINLLSKNDIVIGLTKLTFVKDHLCSSYHVSSDPVLQCQTTALEHDNLSPSPQSQENVPQAAETVITSNELDLLFSLMFNKLFNGTTPVVSKSFAVPIAGTPDQRQQHNTTTSNSTIIVADIPPLNIQRTPETTSQAPTVSATENINQAETNKENAQVEKDKFINLFSIPVRERGETSSRHVDSTRRQIETDGEICMFALTVSQTKPKNIKEAMVDSAWIKAIQEELRQFDRLDVWELVDRPLFKNL
ncbi:retrovirus-related pol polyprotein from transposon TNT 1-94 [Tanacetum coccineum]